ncbi:MAG TPA: glycosyltransferase [Kineosporiaceae bacterium]
MRVLFPLQTHLVSGAERYTLQLAAALRDHGDVAPVIATSPASPLLAAAAADGLPAVPLELGGKLRRRTTARHALGWPAARARLRAAVRDHAPDVVVTQFALEQLLLAGTPGRHVTIRHGPVPAPLLVFPPTRRLLARYQAGCERVFAVSEPVARSVAGRLPGPAAVLLPGGVRTEHVAAAVAGRDRLRREWNVPPGSTLLAYVGRLERSKGLPQALALARSSPALRLVVAGDGTLARELEPYRDADLSASPVRHLGLVTRPLDVFAAADLTVLLTRDPGEGRPLALVESLAVGTPVLGSAHPAIVAARREHGPWVHVAAGAVALADVRAAAAGVAGAARAEVPSWADVASTFVEALAPAPARSPGRRRSPA